MAPKSRNKGSGTSLWHRCEVCRVVLSFKDIEIHKGSCCPPPSEGWSHGFIRKGVIHSWLSEASTDMFKTMPQEELPNIIWISSHVLKMSKICIGDPVIVDTLGFQTVKTVWPTTQKKLSTVYMSKEGLEFAPDCSNAPVTVKKFSHPSPPAKDIVVSLLSKESTISSHTADILIILRSIYCGKYVHVGSLLHVPHYGRKLRFLVDSVSSLSVESQDYAEAHSRPVDALADSFHHMSFSEVRSAMTGSCSTPLQPRQMFSKTNSTVECRDSDHQFGDEDASLSTSFYRMIEDSYTGNSIQESENELSLCLTIPVESQMESFTSKFDTYHVTASSQWTLKSTEENSFRNKSSYENALASIGGLHSVIEELQEVLNLALNPHLPTDYSLKVSRGVLLFGPAGTGKTMVAHALANESKASVHILQGAELFSKLLGETEAKLREFFSRAILSGPAVLILDEIDALCPRKSSGSGGTELERRVVSTLSSLLDGMSNSASRIFVIATTSRLDFVDPVLRRPGRLDREIEVPVPTPDARLDIISKLLTSVPHSLSESEMKSVAYAAHGFVGADLASLVSQAGMRAFHYTQDGLPLCLTLEQINWALSRVHPSAMREVLVDVPNVRWCDIGGQEDLKLKLQQAIEWPLAHPEAFKRLGITPPKGVLMFGPPGCSKTMIAKALATESKLNFLSIKGPELFSKWVGESERAVRELFRRARQVAPAIIFFDEIDALGGERGSSSGSGGSNVQERVLAQLLTEMDGVTALGNVTVVAATNRPDRIDKALLRPGRLDRIVYVPLPDRSTRRQIFDLQLCKMPVSGDVDVEALVKETDGYSGAEVLAVCHEAALKALEEDISALVVSGRHFSEALASVTPRTPGSLLKLYEDYLNGR